MWKVRIRAVAIFASTFVTGTEASAATASDFNAFVRGDYTAVGSDIRGWLAAGGNISASGGHSIGCDQAVNATDDICPNPGTNGAPTTIAGGTITGSSGALYGSSLAGGYSYAQSFSNIGGTRHTYADMASPVDIEAEFARLTALSGDLHANGSNYGTVYDTATTAQWGVFTADAGIQISPYNQLQLIGTDANVNIFDISAADWAKLSAYATLFLSVPDGSVAVLNIGGDMVSTLINSVCPAGAPNCDGGLSTSYATRLLYNFYDATSGTLSSSTYGSILAPQADLQGTAGMLDGQLFANSFTDHGQQINDHAFIDKALLGTTFDKTPTAVPEPATWVMMIAGFGLAGHQLRRRRHAASPVAA